MTSTTSKPPTWRPEGSTTASAPQSGPKWRQEVVLPEHRAHPAAKAARVAGMLTLFTVACGLLVWVSTWLQLPRKTSLVLIGAGYEDNLDIPPNVYGWQALTDFSERTAPRPMLFSRFRELLQIAIGPRRLTTQEKWSKGIEAVTAPTLMVVMSVHGGADTDGAYLLPDDADTDADPKNRLRLRSVIETLGEQPASQSKLLVLDCTQIESQWQLGMLTNDFARQLQALDEEIKKVPKLVVLCASGPDQKSWVSEEWRQTSFLHFLIDGLRGRADIDDDTRVDAAELFQFTFDKVRQWAWSNRIALQTPILVPAGEEGRLRAHAICLTIVDSTTTATEPVEILPYVPPPILKQTWKHCQELASANPSPAIYTPHLWRRYLDVLLRYDSLVRAGADQAWGQVLLAQLEELEQSILAARYVQISSIQNTLSMPALSGREPPSAETEPPLFRDLWNADPKDYAAIWARMNQGVTDSALLRMQCFDILFRRAAEAPGTNLSKACELARVIADPVYPMPAEIHALFMYRRYLPGLAGASTAPTTATALPGEVTELAQKALQLNRIADAVSLSVAPTGYSYSPQVAPWLQGVVNEADQLRLKGQDLLFVGDAESLSLARDNFSKAQRLYETVRGQGEILRRGMTVRDQVLPMLPYYCRWVASLRTGLESAPNAQTREAILKLSEDLCGDAYRLANQVAPPYPGSSPVDGSDVDGRLRDIEELAAKVETEFQEMQDRFLEVWRQYADVNLASLWRDAENALRVPYLDPELRMALIEHSRRISRKFLLETHDVSPTAPSVSEEQNRKMVQARGEREGRMALATLGKQWFDESAGTNLETFDQVQFRLSTFAVEGNWWQSLTTAGGQVAKRFRALMPEIDALVKKASVIGELDARFALQRALRLARLLEGNMVMDASPTPFVDQRKLLVTDTLLWQARRTLAEHWYAEDPATEPYYRVSGLLFIDDATALAPDPWLHDTIAATASQLSQPGDLTFQGPESLALTSEQGIEIEYSLRVGDGAYVPAGFPAVWMEAGNKLNLEFPAAYARLRREIGPKAVPSSITCTVSSPLVANYEVEPSASTVPSSSKVTAQGFFRGQPIQLDTVVRLDTVPPIVVRRLTPPTTASVAVRGAQGVDEQYGASQGVVTFVLDASGSMGPQVGQPFDATVKYAEATVALQSILATLPRGTTFSVWVFGEAVGPDKTVTDPGKSVRQVIAPTLWDPTNANLLPQIMSQLNYPTVEPWNQSPIVRAMLYAKEDLVRVSGPRTMVVISDGMDNCFANDTQLNPSNRSIRTALTEAFGQSAIEIVFLGYKLPDVEEQRSEEQFQVITTFQVPGQYLQIDESAQIAQSVTAALQKSLRFRIETLANVPAPNLPPNGLQVSAPNANAQWYPGGLPPGAYNLNLSAKYWVEKTMLLNRGDLLLVDLLQGPSGLLFQRGVYSSQAFPWRPSRQVLDWRLAVLQNQSLIPNALEMLVTLERMPDPNATLLEMQHPQETWFEVVPPPDVTTRYVQNWNMEYGYPAPAWTLRVPAWPVTPVGQSPAAPTLRAWWSPDQSSKPASMLRQGPDFQSYADIRKRRLSISGNDVTVDSVRIEDHLVETAPQKREKTSCLVIRFTNSPKADGSTNDMLLRAQVDGITSLGREERFFPDSGAQAVLLWPVGTDEALGMTELRVYSLADFKNNAQRRGFQAELGNFGPPMPNDVRPQKPVDLK